MQENSFKGEEAPIDDIIGNAVPTDSSSSRSRKPSLAIIRGGRSRKHRATPTAGRRPRLLTTVVHGDDTVDLREWARHYLGMILMTEGLASDVSMEFDYAS